MYDKFIASRPDFTAIPNPSLAYYVRPVLIRDLGLKETVKRRFREHGLEAMAMDWKPLFHHDFLDIANRGEGFENASRLDAGAYSASHRRSRDGAKVGQDSWGFRLVRFLDLAACGSIKQLGTGEDCAADRSLLGTWAHVADKSSRSRLCRTCFVTLAVHPFAALLDRQCLGEDSRSFGAWSL